jgi:hypothetical protein
LRYVMFTIRTTDVYVLLKHQRDQTLVWFHLLEFMLSEWNGFHWNTLP